MALDLRSSELERSFIKERICNVEKHLYDMSLKLSNYNLKLAQVRDSGDDFAKSVYRFASNENLNQSLRTSLCKFSDIFAALQDYRDAQIQRIDAKSVREFANYNSVCKKVQEDLKRCFEARTTEFKIQSQLEKIRGKYPTNWPKISQAEKEASLARGETTHATHEMCGRIDSFEKKKLEDVKHTFLEFIKIEMMFYAKAIELHTNAYNTIKNIKVEEDLNEFRCHFKALTSSLDSQCLSNVENVLKNVDNPSDTSNMPQNSTPVSNNLESHKSLFAVKNDCLQLENSNSSLKTVSESKFDFGDQSL